MQMQLLSVGRSAAHITLSTDVDLRAGGMPCTVIVFLRQRFPEKLKDIPAGMNCSDHIT